MFFSIFHLGEFYLLYVQTLLVTPLNGHHKALLCHNLQSDKQKSLLEHLPSFTVDVISPGLTPFFATEVDFPGDRQTSRQKLLKTSDSPQEGAIE